MMLLYYMYRYVVESVNGVNAWSMAEEQDFQNHANTYWREPYPGPLGFAFRYRLLAAKSHHK